MRHSVLKTTALALLLVVFVAVVITARWADKPAHYPQVSQEIPAADARSAQDHSALPQTGLSHRADLSQPQVADAFAAAWSGRADSGLIGSKNQDRSLIAQIVSAKMQTKAESPPTTAITSTGTTTWSKAITEVQHKRNAR